VPFLEIGKVLTAGGHRAVVATHAAHRGAVEAAGLTFAPMRPDRPRDAAFHARFMQPRGGPAFVFREFLGPAIAESDADLSAAVAGADVLVSVTLANRKVPVSTTSRFSPAGRVTGIRCRPGCQPASG